MKGNQAAKLALIRLLARRIVQDYAREQKAKSEAYRRPVDRTGTEG